MTPVPLVQIDVGWQSCKELVMVPTTREGKVSTIHVEVDFSDGIEDRVDAAHVGRDVLDARAGLLLPHTV